MWRPIPTVHPGTKQLPGVTVRSFLDMLCIRYKNMSLQITCRAAQDTQDTLVLTAQHCCGTAGRGIVPSGGDAHGSPTWARWRVFRRPPLCIVSDVDARPSPQSPSIRNSQVIRHFFLGFIDGIHSNDLKSLADWRFLVGVCSSVSPRLPRSVSPLTRQRFAEPWLAGA